MTGPPDSAPAPTWEDRATFREVFLLYLPPELQAGAKEVGRTLFATALEQELPALPRPWIHMRLRAVAADLHFLEQFLRAVAEDRFQASLGEEEARLAERAEAWALRLSRIAHRMEEAAP